MYLQRLLIPVLLSIFILGCASASKTNGLKLGMTESDVVQVMGKPDSSSAIEDTLLLRYRLTAGGWFSDEYFVRLQNGKVEAYGRAGDFGLGY